jgi:CDP-glycerol glycerophosphotransferase (TagB/SpsB family)
MHKIFKKLKSAIYLLKLFPLYFLYFVSRYFPRDNKIWIFGSYNDSFIDNSKYLFWYVSDNHSDIRAIWITGSSNILQSLRIKGYKAFKRWSLKGLWYCLRGKVYIYSRYSCDINYWTSAGAIRINLWHGIPLKRIEYDIKVGKLYRLYNSRWTIIYRFIWPSKFQKPHYLLSTSAMVGDIFSGAFKIPKSKIINLGYPRCDHFFWIKEELIKYVSLKSPELLNLIYTLSSFKKALIYMPTFRENYKNDLREYIDLEDLNALLKEKHFLLFIKQHPNLRIEYKNEFSNIIFLSNDFDVYMLLPFIEILITDYSSVMFDFILLHKPVILLMHDLEKYRKSERGFYFEPEEIGFVVCRNYLELKKIIDCESVECKASEEGKYFSLWEGFDGKSSQKLAEFIKRLLYSN